MDWSLIYPMQEYTIYLEDKSKIDEAINYFKKSIGINSKDGISYFNLGNLYKKINDIINAEKFYLLSIKANPMFFDPYINLLDLYERTNKTTSISQEVNCC